MEHLAKIGRSFTETVHQRCVRSPAEDLDNSRDNLGGRAKNQTPEKKKTSAFTDRGLVAFKMKHTLGKTFKNEEKFFFGKKKSR